MQDLIHVCFESAIKNLGGLPWQKKNTYRIDTKRCSAQVTSGLHLLLPDHMMERF